MWLPSLEWHEIDGRWWLREKWCRLLIRLRLRKPPPPLTNEQVWEQINRAHAETRRIMEENMAQTLFQRDNHS